MNADSSPPPLGGAGVVQQHASRTARCASATGTLDRRSRAEFGTGYSAWGGSTAHVLNMARRTSRPTRGRQAGSNPASHGDDQGHGGAPAAPGGGLQPPSSPSLPPIAASLLASALASPSACAAPFPSCQAPTNSPSTQRVTMPGPVVSIVAACARAREPARSAPLSLDPAGGSTVLPVTRAGRSRAGLARARNEARIRCTILSNSGWPAQLPRTALLHSTQPVLENPTKKEHV
mmetsp:Transcript_31300/g.101929  ORF Transcript_31300/g.101929 Transcript_31300/m.101929 type:complete len:234 (+) Transcript_31300:200-901(+)